MSVGGTAHTSTNQFAAFDSDDNEAMDGFERDMGSPSLLAAGSPSYLAAAAASLGHKAKSASTLYSLDSSAACIGFSSHVASSVASALPTFVLIADSGATDHMWPHYDAFTSYTPLSSKYVTLANDSHATMAGIIHT